MIFIPFIPNCTRKNQVITMCSRTTCCLIWKSCYYSRAWYGGLDMRGLIWGLDMGAWYGALDIVGNFPTPAQELDEKNSENEVIGRVEFGRQRNFFNPIISKIGQACRPPYLFIIKVVASSCRLEFANSLSRKIMYFLLWFKLRSNEHCMTANLPGSYLWPSFFLI